MIWVLKEIRYFYCIANTYGHTLTQQPISLGHVHWNLVHCNFLLNISTYSVRKQIQIPFNNAFFTMLLNWPHASTATLKVNDWSIGFSFAPNRQYFSHITAYRVMKFTIFVQHNEFKITLNNVLSGICTGIYKPYIPHPCLESWNLQM